MDYFQLVVILAFIKTSQENLPEIRVVCKVAWSTYRPGFFDTPNIDDANMCTHIVYSYIGIDNSTGTITILDPDRDITGFKHFVNLKEQNPNVKVLVEATLLVRKDGHFQKVPNLAKIASTKESRKVFIKSVVNFLRNHKFDGLDILWENPFLSDTEWRREVEDVENLNLLAKELRDVMSERWSLSIGLSADAVHSNRYDLKTLSKYVDFFNIKFFYYHAMPENTTQLISPLYSRLDGSIAEKTFNVNFTIHLLLQMGVPKEKIVVTMLMYGVVYVLEDPNLTKPGSLFKDVTALRYNGVCRCGFGLIDEKLMNVEQLCNFTEDDGWIHDRDETQMVPYMYRNHTWISYEDRKSLYLKAKFVLENHLGGAAVWSLDADDFLGTCSNKTKTKFPLLDAVLKGLGKRPVNGDLELILAESSASITSTVPRSPWLLVSVSLIVVVNI